MNVYQTLLAWVVLLSVPIAAMVGWIMNISALLYNNEGLARVALRVVGIFIFPLGCILGYF